ncbi:sporulation kinase A [Desulfosporosinus acididurans]|uniref:Sporulation kinase A n=1 Tax=Desulfosporosinus acididurans TaxID=476652 RepID=A0A0J1FY23_9FIRM|nr:ATP-binding protein [Desulfosporosinus acididurans]KLU67908.1 sporulation kinase A [Desulfosporosinus acididurans]
MLDEKEICQVILNFTKNAFEAMPNGGTLAIKTYCKEKAETVVLEIQDQGKGIEPEILDKIGTPFFTTKDEGTGLCLAVRRGLNFIFSLNLIHHCRKSHALKK